MTILLRVHVYQTPLGFSFTRYNSSGYAPSNVMRTVRIYLGYLP